MLEDDSSHSATVCDGYVAAEIGHLHLVERLKERTSAIWCTTLPPAPVSVPAARRFASEAVVGLGAPEVVSDAELLVSELAANAVAHARTPVRISVLRCDRRVRVEVRDDDPTLPQHITPEPFAQHGRGVMLVDLLADAWGVNGSQRGKTVWFELDPPTS